MNEDGPLVSCMLDMRLILKYYGVSVYDGRTQNAAGAASCSHFLS